jgi:hypothetical protein
MQYENTNSARLSILPDAPPEMYNIVVPNYTEASVNWPLDDQTYQS